ncbi:hypothetical protein Poli38472_013450 [Pythium oligandrum]|uniref:EGF-like domain-containing protein n=1 Tax=Pythium oligandrum TaxID=41045 RepID=A0A8K1FD65_PYTOL|nr:hypothetical protein Poli38472_013450 [Pythium oligandrum]|eukprot:TMW57976.1 hypothetical protein Poli38472_013450 [Pythium oligandrum]
MSCPEGAAWVDYASDTDIAHAPAECSNMGTCDRTSGTCRCMSGFEGAACERMSCPTCTNGRCISMREAAQIQDNTNFFVSTTYDLWDADKIYGCQCDNGFTGWDCSQRECPKGDDPMSTGQVSEVQQLNCRCDGCTGSFVLTFRRRSTRNLLPTETDASLKAALESLDTVFGVTITIGGGKATICDATGSTTSITFTKNPGNLPDLQIQNRLNGGATTPVLTLSSSGATGAYDTPPPSVDGFTSSDGAGVSGNRGDCGVGTTTSCPTTSNGVCDGTNKGTCSGPPNYVCNCVTGYTGYDCTQRTCPKGIAWFDGATAPNTAHAMAVCSNRGSCDTRNGLCNCNSLFTGSACEVLKCPGSTTSCNGHGTCLNMQQLAAQATTPQGNLLGITYGVTINTPSTWDATKIQGCACMQGYYLGPYSGAVGNFRDYDCTSRFCPLGADPYETGKVNEKQTLACLADGGTFTLTFRQQTTATIAFNADAATVKSALEKLSSITAVTVSFSGTSTTVCDGTAAVTTTIEFTWEQGDLPILTASTAALTLSVAPNTPSLLIAELQKGTKANIECSGRGSCGEKNSLFSLVIVYKLTIPGLFCTLQIA